MPKKVNPFQASFLCPKYWGIWLGFGFLKAITLFPYKTRFTIGKTIGNLLFLVATSRKRLAKKNLEIAFPEKKQSEIKILLKEHFQSLGIGLAEMATNFWGEHRNTKGPKGDEHFTFHGLENLEPHQQEGILFVVPHFTTIETSGLMLSFVSDIRPVYRPHDNPLMEYLITKSRTVKLKHDARAVEPIANTNTRGMVKALRNKEHLIILPDQRSRDDNKVLVPFFGIEAPSNPGICKLTELGKAIVLPVFTRRIGYEYEMTILPALEDFPSGDNEKDVLRLHQLYEAEIKQNPAQYLWTHNRWNLPSKSWK